MSFLKIFLTQIEEQSSNIEENSNLLDCIKKAKNILLNKDFLPSVDLINALNKLQRRAEEPMKVAIAGQFSSGKSTFLNALLSKEVLPTGLTPVTSKLNYIRYDNDFKIKLKYKDGREIFCGIENLANFTDQRQAVEDVLNLTLYAPIPLLKEVIFIDTPGLNSQAHSDTQTTEEVLKEVDGIIWLTLIDNAGRQSEIEVLEKYMQNYQNKAICVLNQKDKLSEEDIEKSIEHVKKYLADFFDEVIAISAKEALKSRLENFDSKVQIYIQNMLNKLKAELSNFDKIPNLENLNKILNHNIQEILNIQKSDEKENLKLYENSNMQKVLDYIDKNIRANSKEAKEYAIKKELKNICQNIIKQHEIILSIYNELEEIIITFDKKAQENFVSLNKLFSKQVQEAYLKILEIIDKITEEIYSKVFLDKKIRYSKHKKGLFDKQEVYKAFEYEVAKINSDEIFKKLFFDENIIGKMFKTYVLNLEQIKENLNEKNHQIYKDLETNLILWQQKYEVIRKNKDLYSDLEFANLRRFASKSYENFLKSYNDSIKTSYAKMSSEFNHLYSALSFNYQNATEVCIAFLERKIAQSVELYEQDSTMFSLYQPNIEDIKNRLKTSFFLYDLENKMNSSPNFVSKNYKQLKEDFSDIKIEKLNLIKESKNHNLNAIKTIEEFFRKI